MTAPYHRAPALAAALALAVFLPSLAGGFLYDDAHVIVENRAIRNLAAWRTVLAFEPSRPLLNLSWALNYAASGLTPWPYHLVNVLLHAANAALLTSLLLYLSRRRGAITEAAAALTGWLFAVTPMAAEAVAYVASRSSLLASFFALAGLRLALPALVETRPARLAAAVALFVLAMATKEEAAAIPLLLLLLDYFFVADGSVRALTARGGGHAIVIALPLVGLLARRALVGTWSVRVSSDLSVARYLWTQWTVFPAYLFHALVPLSPAFYRGYGPAAWPPGAGGIAGAALTLVVMASALLRRRDWPLWSFAVAWLAAALLPSSSLVPLSEMVVDHRAYLGGAGALLLLGTFLLRLPRAAGAMALVALALVAVRYERILADPVAAWRDAVAQAPADARAHMGLAEAYAAAGDTRAEGELQATIAIAPDNAQALTNLGALYTDQRRYGEAVEAFARAARVAPGDARIHDNLGLLLRAVGQNDAARAAFERALRVDPTLAQPRLDLADFLLERGEIDRARALVEEASRLQIDAQDAATIERLRRRLEEAQRPDHGR